MIIVQWIGAAMLIAGVLAGAAALVESLFAHNASRRLVWSGALVAGLVLPIVLSLTTPLREKVIREQRTGQVQDREIPATTIVSVGWALLSTAVLIQLLLGHRAVRREISTAEPVTVFGHRVHLGEFGPAVVGFIRPRVVIPRWVSGLPPEDQRLIVAHEAEHVASGDQLLLLIGLAAVVLMPWNPAAWMALMRLRRAIELDCDARVAAGADAARYGRVLLDARLRGPIAPVFNLAFARPAIQTRIEALLTTRRAAPREIVARAAAAILLLALTPLIQVPRISIGFAGAVAPRGGVYTVAPGQGERDSSTTPGGVMTLRETGGRARFTPRPDSSRGTPRGGVVRGRAQFRPAPADTVTPF